MLTKEQVAALLGRPLTSTEDTNFETYIDIAVKRVSSLLCISLDSDTNPRKFSIRPGYRTVYIDPFTALTSVSVNGEIVDSDSYTTKLNDSYQSSWFNSIEFDEPQYDEPIEVSATWGFGAAIPDDLALLIAQVFGIQATETSGAGVKEKEIEDFKVVYGNSPQFVTTVTAYGDIVARYAQCERGVLHGAVRTVCY